MAKAAKPVAKVTVIMRCTPLMGGLVYSCEVRYPLQVRQTRVPVTLQLMQSDTAAMLPQVMQQFYRAPTLTPDVYLEPFVLAKPPLAPAFSLRALSACASSFFFF